MAATTLKVEDELIIRAPGLEIPAEIQDKAKNFIDAYVNRLTAQTEAYIERKAKTGGGVREPTLASGYQYWNALTVGPIQFFGNPPYRPSKIIAAGELAMILGVVWINPANSDGGGLPGTVVLGARPYRVRFETVNISTVSNGPDFTSAGIFTSPAPVVSVFPWFFVPGDPGQNPNLYETHLTVDITTMGQPMAAFSSWHFETDLEPPFLGLPAVPPHWEHNEPAKYMVYRR